MKIKNLKRTDIKITNMGDIFNNLFCGKIIYTYIDYVYSDDTERMYYKMIKNDLYFCNDRYTYSGNLNWRLISSITIGHFKDCIVYDIDS